MKNKTFDLTYKKSRRCKHCDAPIADQAHKKRHFCKREVLEDGTVKSCHDDYHSERRAEKDAPSREENHFQTGARQTLQALYQIIGTGEVTLERLNSLGTDLEKALRHQAKEGSERLYVFFFRDYRLEQQSMFTFKTYPI